MIKIASGKTWTREEKLQLKRGYRANQTLPEIVERIKKRTGRTRSENAIQVQAHKMNLRRSEEYIQHIRATNNYPLNRIRENQIRAGFLEAK